MSHTPTTTRVPVTPTKAPWGSRYSVLTLFLVLCAHPILGTPCSPYPWYSVLTLSLVLRAHPIPGTMCSPYPWYSVFTPFFGTVCSPHPRYSHPRYSVLTPSRILRVHHPKDSCSLPSQVLHACSPPCQESVLTPSQVLRTHPILGTPCSPHPRPWASTQATSTCAWTRSPTSSGALSPLLWCPFSITLAPFPRYSGALSPLLWRPFPVTMVPSPTSSGFHTPLLVQPIVFNTFPRVL